MLFVKNGNNYHNEKHAFFVKHKIITDIFCIPSTKILSSQQKAENSANNIKSFDHDGIGIQQSVD